MGSSWSENARRLQGLAPMSPKWNHTAVRQMARCMSGKEPVGSTAVAGCIQQSLGTSSFW